LGLWVTLSTHLHNEDAPVADKVLDFAQPSLSGVDIIQVTHAAKADSIRRVTGEGDLPNKTSRAGQACRGEPGSTTRALVFSGVRLHLLLDNEYSFGRMSDLGKYQLPKGWAWAKIPDLVGNGASSLMEIG